MYNNKRSKHSTDRRNQKRAAKQYILQYGYNDNLKHEVISLTEEADVQTYLGQAFGYCDQSAVPTIFKGIVLVNDYGHGAFQTEGKPEITRFK